MPANGPLILIDEQLATINAKTLVLPVLQSLAANCKAPQSGVAKYYGFAFVFGVLLGFKEKFAYLCGVLTNIAKCLVNMNFSAIVSLY